MIYIIRAGIAGDVKIGTAGSPLARLRSLQTAHPQKLRLVRVLEGGRKEEAILHARFADLRKTGEWFAFCQEMVQGDLGLVDLPIPFPKRNNHRTDTPWGRLYNFHDDIARALGGHDEVAKRLGVAPWDVWNGITFYKDCYSALVLMMRDAGYKHVTLSELKALEHANSEDLRKQQQASSERSAKDLNERRANMWLKKHGRAAAWWLTSETNEKEDEAA